MTIVTFGVKATIQRAQDTLENKEESLKDLSFENYEVNSRESSFGMIKQGLTNTEERDESCLANENFPECEIHTFQEIGDLYSLTRERIRQIESKALRKLRMPENAKLLRDLWEHSMERR